MRFLVQIAAIFAFVLVSSQFSHGHESSDSATPHVHAHEIADQNHDGSSNQLLQDNAVHCGALLLFLVSDTQFAYARTFQKFDRFLPISQKAIHLTFDPPPPRA